MPRQITREVAMAEGWYQPNERGGRCYCGCGELAPIAQQGSRKARSVAGEPLRYQRGHISRVANPYASHGMRGLPEYRAWTDMRMRCRSTRERFAAWNGRGITVCARWADFTVFLADMGPKPSPQHSLDRIDNDGNYEPDNCRWATALEQRHNQRRSLVVAYS
jgi:hypothetical protein